MHSRHPFQNPRTAASVAREPWLGSIARPPIGITVSASGGRFASTRFDRFANGTREERHGPFRNYDRAVREWNRLAWKTVDDCHFRYRIVEEEPVARQAVGLNGNADPIYDYRMDNVWRIPGFGR